MKRHSVPIHCDRCGWEATVHSVPVTEEYQGTDWFCPHCGTPGCHPEPVTPIHGRGSERISQQPKWTPGEWKREGRFIVDEDGQLIATVIEGKQPWEANLTVMKAAPEMVKALQLAMRYLEHPDVQAMPFALSAKVPLERAQAALHKAGALIGRCPNHPDRARVSPSSNLCPECLADR